MSTSSIELIKISSHPRIRNTKNHPSLQNHFQNPIVIVKSDENLCHIAPITANGYKIDDKMTKTAIPKSPIGM